METELFNRMQLVSSLMKIGHGDLSLYENVGLPAAKADPELFAHLTAWNAVKGEVRDSKVAYPPIALRGVGKGTREFAENAVAHMMLLAPRELVRSYHFSKDLSKKGLNIQAGYRRMLERALKAYVQSREAKRSWWDKAVIRNRKAMVELYAIAHAKPAPFAQEILFDRKYPKGSVFEAIANLKTMQPQEAAGTILQFDIPMPIAIGAISKKDPEVLLALIEKMSGNELINSTGMLKKAGALANPILKSAVDAAIVRAKDDKRVSTLKAGRAAEALDEDMSKKIIQVQNARLEKLGGIEGNWLVLGDKSGSMALSLEIARRVSALIAQQVKDKVYLVLFDVEPRLIDVTGCTLDQITAATRHFTANGGTSIGCGVDYVREKGYPINGIAICSDGCDNTSPLFADAYARYEKQMGIAPTVAFFKVPTAQSYWQDKPVEQQCQSAGIGLQVFDVGQNVDYYSLPALVKMLKTSRYALLDEILATPLVTLSQIFD